MAITSPLGFGGFSFIGGLTLDFSSDGQDGDLMTGFLWDETGTVTVTADVGSLGSLALSEGKLWYFYYTMSDGNTRVNFSFSPSPSSVGIVYVLRSFRDSDTSKSWQLGTPATDSGGARVHSYDAFDALASMGACDVLLGCHAFEPSGWDSTPIGSNGGWDATFYGANSTGLVTPYAMIVGGYEISHASGAVPTVTTDGTSLGTDSEWGEVVLPFTRVSAVVYSDGGHLVLPYRRRKVDAKELPYQIHSRML